MANPLIKNQVVRFLARIVAGGLVATGVIAGGIRLAEFNSAGSPSPSATYIARDYVNVFCSATGGNVKTSYNGLTGTGAKYNTCIVRNPLAALGAGSGVITRASLEMGNNPAGVGFDCGFVKGVNAGSGSELFNGVVLATGAIAFRGTGSFLWNGADYVKCGTLDDPTAGFSARLRLEYSDIYGE